MTKYKPFLIGLAAAAVVFFAYTLLAGQPVGTFKWFPENTDGKS